jgi:chorismate synthase
MMSIPSVKAVEIGTATAAARSLGSEVHDPISYNRGKKVFCRKTNRAGGLEGGISNGSDIRVRIYLKPIPTLTQPLPSVDVLSKEVSNAAVERSDTCVVPAGGVIAEAMLGFVLARAFLDKFGGDSMTELEQNHSNYLKLLKEY